MEESTVIRLDKNISYLIKIIIIFISLSSLFYFSIEIIEIISNEENISFLITKLLVYVACILLIFINILNNNLKYLFISSLTYLIFTCMLFFIHLLLEIHIYSINTDNKLLIFLNMISVFFSIYSSILLFLLYSALVQMNHCIFYLYR